MRVAFAVVPPMSNAIASSFPLARPSAAAAIAGFAVFALYVLTLSPETAMWDTSEYIAAAYTLGIPHPPGNPMFVLVGRVAAILPIPGTSVAMRVNLLAALSSAVAAAMYRDARWTVPTGHRLDYIWDLEKGRRDFATALAAVDAAQAHPSGRLSGMLAPMQVDTCSPELMRDSLAAVLDYYCECVADCSSSAPTRSGPGTGERF